MEIVILPTPAEVGRLAARKIGQVIARKPTAVIGLATGSSPLAIYAELAASVRDGLLDAGQVRGFALDEYVGIPEDHPESYASVLRREVTRAAGPRPAATCSCPTVAPPTSRRPAPRTRRRSATRAASTCRSSGIGANGHIGFNEPTSSFASRTRLKTLAPRTRADNARFFADPDDVPTHCLTQGLGTIMDARELLLVAQGEAKAAAIAAAVEGPVTSICPGSILQFHPHATSSSTRTPPAGLQPGRLLPAHLREQARLAALLASAR